MSARIKGFDRVLAQIARRKGIFLAIERRGSKWVLLRPGQGQVEKEFFTRQTLRMYLKELVAWDIRSKW